MLRKHYYTHMNLYFYKKKSIHIRIQNYSHMKNIPVCLQIESYNWDLSSRSAGLKCVWEPHSYRTTAISL